MTSLFGIPHIPLPLGVAANSPSPVPPGTIVVWAGIPEVASPPGGPLPAPQPYPLEESGWMICDGRSLKVSNYPKLYWVLGNQYGGDATAFNIPNLEGQFLRGVTTDTSKDPDCGSRVPANPSQAQYPVGSTQVDTFQDHVHGYNSAQATGVGGNAGVVATELANQLTTPPKTDPAASPARDVSYSSETRPKNTYVYFIIRTF
jgi:rhizosphere induced protein